MVVYTSSTDAWGSPFVEYPLPNELHSAQSDLIVTDTAAVADVVGDASLKPQNESPLVATTPTTATSAKAGSVTTQNTPADVPHLGELLEALIYEAKLRRREGQLQAYAIMATTALLAAVICMYMERVMRYIRRHK